MENSPSSPEENYRLLADHCDRQSLQNLSLLIKRLSQKSEELAHVSPDDTIRLHRIRAYVVLSVLNLHDFCSRRFSDPIHTEAVFSFFCNQFGIELIPKITQEKYDVMDETGAAPIEQLTQNTLQKLRTITEQK